MKRNKNMAIKNPAIAKLVEEAEEEVTEEEREKQKVELKEVIREIKKGKQVVKRLEAKRERLVASLDD